MKAFFLVILTLFAGCVLRAQPSLTEIKSAKEDTAKLGLIWKVPKNLKSSEGDQLISIISEIKERAEKQNDFKLLKEVEIALASIDYDAERYKLAIPRLNALLRNNANLNAYDSVRIFFMLKNTYVFIKNPALAFEAHKVLSGLNHRGQIKEPYLMNPPLSVIYMDMGQYADGVAQLRKEYIEDLKNGRIGDMEAAQFYNNLGVYFKRWKILDSAIVCFNKSVQLINRLQEKEQVNDDLTFFDALVDGNKGSVLAMQGDYSAAVPLMEKDYSISRKYKFYESAANALVSLADCYKNMHELKRARLAIDSAFYYFNLSHKQRVFLEAVKVNAEIFAASGNYKNSVEEFQKYTRLKDSIYEVDKQIQMINNQTAFEVGEKERELHDQELKIEENQRALDKSKSDKVILILAIVAALLISIILFIANKSSAKKQKELSKKNDEILAKNQLIESSLSEKEALIKEVHHRVKNNLQIVSSLLRLQSSKQSEEHVQVMFEESVKRIRSMALVHELLYKNKNIASIPIQLYIENLVRGLSASFGFGEQIIINVECNVVELDIDTTVPLGLIINELVTNSMKHAFDKNNGIIDVSFMRYNNKYHLIVKDNGKGLPENFENMKGNSLGMELVEALAEQLGANYKYSGSNGSKFEFEF